MSVALADLGVDEDLKFTLRWTKWLQRRNPDSSTQIVSSTWEKLPSDASATLLSDTSDAESTTVKIRGGGDSGEEVGFKNTIVTSDNETAVRYLLIRIVDKK